MQQSPEDEQRVADVKRQFILQEMGLKFLRFEDEAVRKDMDFVIRSIEEFIEAEKKNQSDFATLQIT